MLPLCFTRDVKCPCMLQGGDVAGAVSQEDEYKAFLSQLGGGAPGAAATPRPGAPGMGGGIKHEGLGKQKHADPSLQRLSPSLLPVLCLHSMPCPRGHAHKLCARPCLLLVSRSRRVGCCLYVLHSLGCSITLYELTSGPLRVHFQASGRGGGQAMSCPIRASCMWAACRTR